MRMKMSVRNITEMFEDKIVELQEEPEFQWRKEKVKYATDDEGDPSVKLAIGNMPL